MRSIFRRFMITGAAVAAFVAFSYTGLHDVLRPEPDADLAHIERAASIALPAAVEHKVGNLSDVITDRLRALALISAAQAQTYPTSQPVYVPTPSLSPVSIPAASAPTTVTFVTQGLGDVTFRLSGTYTGLSATIEATNDLTSAPSPTWTAIGITPVGTGGAMVKNITAAQTGLYKVGGGGWTKLRLNVSALSTGTLVVNAAGSGAAFPGRVNTPIGPNTGQIIVVTGQATATINSSDQDYGARGVTCFLNQTTHTGSTSTVYTIDNKDIVSGNYVEIARSNAVSTADQTPIPLTVYPGLGAVSGVTVSAALASKFRLRMIVGSTGTINATVACDPIL